VYVLLLIIIIIIIIIRFVKHQNVNRLPWPSEVARFPQLAVQKRELQIHMKHEKFCEPTALAREVMQSPPSVRPFVSTVPLELTDC